MYAKKGLCEHRVYFICSNKSPPTDDLVKKHLPLYPEKGQQEQAVVQERNKDVYWRLSALGGAFQNGNAVQ